MGRNIFALFVVLAAAGQTAADDNRAKVSLAASTDAIAPDGETTIALRFELKDGWHLYWRYQGDSGKPPTVDWTLPEGFEMGPLRFPGPKRHVDEAGNVQITTYILEDAPILTAELSSPQEIEEKEVTIYADLSWLICKELCVHETGEASITLPVAADTEAVQPANEDIFARVEATHPKANGKGTYLTVEPSGPNSVAVGEPVEIKLKLDVAEGHHIQSHNPLIDGLVATEVFVDRPDGVQVGDARFPEPDTRVLRGVGRTSEFHDEVTVRVPVTVTENFEGESMKLFGVVRYQACDARTNQCARPEFVAWEISIPVGAPAGDEAAVSGDASKQAGEGAEGEPDSGGPKAQAGEDGATDEAAGAEEDEEGATFLEVLLKLGTPGLLIACFLYGLALNATPCVFPVLSIKVIGFVQQAQESRRRTAMLGLTFGAGVLLFFVILGGIASRGQNILQYPVVVITLGAIVMALSLSLLGVYNLQVPTAASKLEARIQREGMLASFGKGALAPVLGFACTGPLLAGAFGWATKQPPTIAVLAFLAAGLGMAAPYMLLGANPKWLSFLPKPGPWMVTFERIMGFLLLAMVIWLISPLTVQIGAAGFKWTLVFFISLAMACWILGRITPSMEAGQIWRHRATAGAIAVVAGFVIYGWVYPIGEAKARQAERITSGAPGDESWRVWSRDAVNEAVTAGNPVFVDVTAAWCTVCKVNKARAIDTEPVEKAFDDLGYVRFRADFTLQDPEIGDLLEEHDRGSSPPLNLIYPPGKPDSPIVLEPNLTKQYLLDKLKQGALDETSH